MIFRVHRRRPRIPQAQRLAGIYACMSTVNNNTIGTKAMQTQNVYSTVANHFANCMAGCNQLVTSWPNCAVACIQVHLLEASELKIRLPSLRYKNSFQRKQDTMAQRSFCDNQGAMSVWATSTICCAGMVFAYMHMLVSSKHVCHQCAPCTAFQRQRDTMAQRSFCDSPGVMSDWMRSATCCTGRVFTCMPIHVLQASELCHHCAPCTAFLRKQDSMAQGCDTLCNIT